MNFRIQAGKTASIFVVADNGEPVRDENLVKNSFSAFPESQLTMLMDRCERDISYLHEIDLRYMASRIAVMLKEFLKTAPAMAKPAEILVPGHLRSLVPGEGEIIPVEEFIKIFATKDFTVKIPPTSAPPSQDPHPS